MEKTLSVILALVLVLALFASCSKGTATGDTAASIDSLKTIGDILDLNLDGETQNATYESKYVYVFQIDDVYYRAIANIDETTSQAIFDLDFSDPDYEEKQKELISPLEIETLENISENILSQEEMDAFIGKTGEDLINAGWESGMGYNIESMEFYLDYKLFEYNVEFEGTVDYNEDDFDENEAIKPLVVKSISFNSIGDATNIEIPEE